MATMNVSLPDPMKSWVESRTRDGRYSNVSDYMRDLIRRDQEREQAISEIQVLIDEGLDSGPSGDFDMSTFIARKTAEQDRVSRRVRLRPAAETDLEQIWDYSVGRWSQAQAVAYLGGLDAVLGLLAEYPDIARLRQEFRPAVRIHPYREHMAIFLSDDTLIDVLRVVHRRTNWSDFLSEQQGRGGRSA